MDSPQRKLAEAVSFDDLVAQYGAAGAADSGEGAHAAGAWVFQQWRDALQDLAAEREAALKLKCALQQVETERNAYKSKFQGGRSEAATAKLEAQAAKDEVKKMEQRLEQQRLRQDELEQKLNAVIEEKTLAATDFERPTPAPSEVGGSAAGGHPMRTASAMSLKSDRFGSELLEGSVAGRSPSVFAVRAAPPPTPPAEPHVTRLVRGALPDFTTIPAAESAEVVKGALKTVKTMAADIEGVITSKTSKRVSPARVIQMQEEALFAVTLLHQALDMIVFMEDIARGVTADPGRGARLSAKEAAHLLNDNLRLHKSYHQVAAKAKGIVGKLRTLLLEGGHHGPLAVDAPPRYQRAGQDAAAAAAGVGAVDAPRASVVTSAPTPASAHLRRHSIPNNNHSHAAPGYGVDDPAPIDDDDDYFGTF